MIKEIIEWLKDGHLLDVVITAAFVGFLSSAVTATITAKLNALYNHQLKMIEYRNAYYQKLAERRLAALDCMREFLMLLQDTILLDGKRTIRRIYYLDPSDYQEKLPQIFKTFSYEMWLTVEAREKFIDLKSIFSDINDEIVKKKFDANFMIDISLANDQLIMRVAGEFYRALNAEYFEAHDFEPLKMIYKELKLPNPGWFQSRKRLLQPRPAPKIVIPQPDRRPRKTE